MRERLVALVFCGEKMFALAPHRAQVRLTPPRPYLPACLLMGSGASMVMKCLWRARWGGLVAEWILRTCLYEMGV